MCRSCLVQWMCGCGSWNRCDLEWHFEGFGLSSDVVSEVVWLGCVGCGSAGYEGLRVRVLGSSILE